MQVKVKGSQWEPPHPNRARSKGVHRCFSDMSSASSLDLSDLSQGNAEKTSFASLVTSLRAGRPSSPPSRQRRPLPCACGLDAGRCPLWGLQRRHTWRCWRGRRRVLSPRRRVWRRRLRLHSYRPSQG